MKKFWSKVKEFAAKAARFVGWEQLKHLLLTMPVALVLVAVWSWLPAWVAGGATLAIIQVAKEQREGAAKCWYGKSINGEGMPQPPLFGWRAELYGLRRVLGIGEDPERRDTFKDAFVVGGMQVLLGCLVQFVVG